jgi:YD repeat-containing protein
MRAATASKWIPILLIMSLGQLSAFAQYYYKDILGAKESSAKQERFKETKVRKVVVHSYAADGTEDTDFVCNQSLSADYTRMETVTNAPSIGNSMLTSYYDASSHLVRSVDSNATAATTMQYVYDASGNLLSVTSLSNANNPDSGWTTSKEEHLWQYSASGQPTAMLKIKDGRDTTFVRLQVDAQGNVSDEITSRKGSQEEHYFYYYDDAHHLTDIVRYNRMLQRMLPDYMFEYDDAGRLVQMTVIQAINSNYSIWRYKYDDNGLRSKEICYDNTKQPVGSIGYSYQP